MGGRVKIEGIHQRLPGKAAVLRTPDSAIGGSHIKALATRRHRNAGHTATVGGRAAIGLRLDRHRPDRGPAIGG